MSVRFGEYKERVELTAYLAKIRNNSRLTFKYRWKYQCVWMCKERERESDGVDKVTRNNGSLLAPEQLSDNNAPEDGFFSRHDLHQCTVTEGVREEASEVRHELKECKCIRTHTHTLIVWRRKQEGVHDNVKVNDSLLCNYQQIRLDAHTRCTVIHKTRSTKGTLLLAVCTARGKKEKETVRGRAGERESVPVVLESSLRRWIVLLMPTITHHAKCI